MTASLWANDYKEISNDDALGFLENLINLSARGWRFGLIERDGEGYVTVATRQRRRTREEMIAINNAYRFGTDIPR